ncbi:MAG TPA: NAD(P)H-quinone oxidoreductase [Noviherbaspirillum sp.]
MRFVQHGKGGPAEILHIETGERPQPRSGEVLIEVHTAGINRPDVLQRSGVYPPPPGASPVLGLEVAGTIVDIADDVSGWKIGDRVCALTPGGGYAEYCTAPARNCLPIPGGLSMVEAAALPENYFTVWTNVFERGALRAGETFLVHGGSSGIGLTAIQLAKEFGANVITTVGGANKAEFCRRIGADLAINYREQDFAEEVMRHTGKRGVDVILDMVGGDYINKNIRSLALNGRLVQIAFLQGSNVQIDAMPIMLKRLVFTGSTLRPRTVEEKAGIAAALQEKVWPALAAGRCKPVIHQVFPLEDAASAHKLMESSTHIGKIMLAVRP